MSRKAVAAKVNGALERNRTAYSEGRIERESKNYTKSTITDKLYRASKLDKLQEVRKSNVKVDKHTLQ